MKHQTVRYNLLIKRQTDRFNSLHKSLCYSIVRSPAVARTVDRTGCQWP